MWIVVELTIKARVKGPAGLLVSGVAEDMISVTRPLLLI